VGVGQLKVEVDPSWRNRMIAGLLRGYKQAVRSGVHPYDKWKGAHWLLVSLVELGVTRTDRTAHAAAENVLRWIASPTQQKPKVITGRERRHASMEGNALAACCRLGMAEDPRVRTIAEVLLRSQWPDGGWNCDVNPAAHRSSFHESLAPMWGLVEFHNATGDRNALASAQRAGELLLSHHVFLSTTSGQPIHPEWTHIHWPHYWHYDFFQGLRAIAMLGRLADPRASQALTLLRSLRRSDGTWRTGGRRYWRLSGSSTVEVVDWGNAHEIVTPNALAMVQ
jgi:hypothetical protein